MIGKWLYKKLLQHYAKENIRELKLYLDDIAQEIRKTDGKIDAFTVMWAVDAARWRLHDIEQADTRGEHHYM